MPALKRVVISGVRNIREAELQPQPGFNIIHGSNGSGKTSLLEAIYVLSHGRSFRGHQQRPLITEGLPEALVFGETTAGRSIGVSRPARGAVQMRIGGTQAGQLAELARELPVQLLNSDAFTILEGSPKDRRAFLDWGVFHVKHQFLEPWRKAKRALLNRNVLLKQGAETAQIEPWTHELVAQAEQIHRLRLEYLDTLLQLFSSSFIGEELREALPQSLEIDYHCGWNAEEGLLRQLQEHLPRERRYGHTLYGPHRADLVFRCGSTNSAELLSRGQIKLLVAGLKVIQARMLRQERDQDSIFLVDDLPAELDGENQARVWRWLEESGVQVFLTAIEASGLPGEAAQGGLFHVKHGKISAS